MEAFNTEHLIKVKYEGRWEMKLKECAHRNFKGRVETIQNTVQANLANPCKYKQDHREP